MKYSFIFDKDFKENNILDLSQEEIRVVLATVLGKHNAIFYGYKPERLVNAVRKLSRYTTVTVPIDYTIDEVILGENCLASVKGNTLIINKLDTFSKYLYPHIMLHTVVGHRSFQVVATSVENPTEMIDKCLVENFDIFYECVEHIKNPPVTTPNLRRVIDKCIEARSGWNSGKFIMGDVEIVSSRWFEFSEYDKNNKLLRVCRSLADIDCCCNATLDYYKEANKYCKVEEDEI